MDFRDGTCVEHNTRQVDVGLSLISFRLSDLILIKI